jgi:hypothetical protein
LQEVLWYLLQVEPKWSLETIKSPINYQKMTCKNFKGRFPSKRRKVRFRDFSPLIILHRTKFSSPNLEIIGIEEDPGSNFPSFIL